MTYENKFVCLSVTLWQRFSHTGACHRCTLYSFNVIVQLDGNEMQSERDQAQDQRLNLLSEVSEETSSSSSTSINAFFQVQGKSSNNACGLSSGAADSVRLLLTKNPVCSCIGLSLFVPRSTLCLCQAHPKLNWQQCRSPIQLPGANTPLSSS